MGLTGYAAPRQCGDTTSYVDAVTGFTFASYTGDYDITFRIAVPSPVPADTVFDTVLQVVAPIKFGWFGIAWGGSMTYNPLAIAWANGTNGVVVSSREAV